MSINQQKQVQDRILGRTIGREISPTEAEEVTGGLSTFSTLGRKDGGNAHDQSDNDNTQ